MHVCCDGTAGRRSQSFGKGEGEGVIVLVARLGICASTITRAASSEQRPPLACHKDGSKQDHDLLLVPSRVHLHSYRIVKTMILNLKADGPRIR